jgi:hypothetical protein
MYDITFMPSRPPCVATSARPVRFSSYGPSGKVRNASGQSCGQQVKWREALAERRRRRRPYGADSTGEAREAFVVETLFPVKVHAIIPTSLRVRHDLLSERVHRILRR